MSWLHALLYGLVQGLTEFLPISSSGHLRLLPEVLGTEDPGAGFTAIIQLGTMAAVLLYFRKDLFEIATAWISGLLDRNKRSNLHYRLGWLIILGTVPISIAGLVFKDQIEGSLRNLNIIGITLIVFGLILYAADRFGSHKKDIDQLTTKDGLAIGVAQALALIPGVSRSGATMSAAMILGFDRATAARYSFLLSVPAVVLSGLFELKSVGEGNSPGLSATIVATVVSFAVGYAAIAWMIKWLASHSVAVFTIYRVLIGAGVLALIAAGTISA